MEERNKEDVGELNFKSDVRTNMCYVPRRMLSFILFPNVLIKIICKDVIQILVF